MNSKLLFDLQNINEFKVIPKDKLYISVFDFIEKECPDFTKVFDKVNFGILFLLFKFVCFSDIEKEILIIRNNK